MPVSLMLLDTPADKAWRLNAIPGNLEAFAEMDDTTRRSDLERGGGRQRQAPTVGNDGNGEFTGDLLEMQPASSDDSAHIDEDVLKRLFAKSGGLPCPKCDKPVQDFEISSGDTIQTVALTLSPCGCTISASDLR